MALDILAPDVSFLVKDIEDAIEKKRTALERPDKDAVETAQLRGHIKGLRFVINLINGDHEEDDHSTN